MIKTWHSAQQKFRLVGEHRANAAVMARVAAAAEKAQRDAERRDHMSHAFANITGDDLAFARDQWESFHLFHWRERRYLPYGSDRRDRAYYITRKTPRVPGEVVRRRDGRVYGICTAYDPHCHRVHLRVPRRTERTTLVAVREIENPDRYRLLGPGSDEAETLTIRERKVEMTYDEAYRKKLLTGYQKRRYFAAGYGSNAMPFETMRGFPW